MSQQLKNITRTSKIFVRNNDVDKALRILKKKLLLEGVVKEVREKRHFTPPGEKRRLEAKAGRKRWLKKREQIEQRMVRAEQNAMKKHRNKNKKHVPRQDKNSGRPQHSNNTPRFKSK